MQEIGIGITQDVDMLAAFIAEKTNCDKLLAVAKLARGSHTCNCHLTVQPQFQCLSCVAYTALADYAEAEGGA